MTGEFQPEAQEARIEADPKRPYKAIAAAVVAVLITVVQVVKTQNGDGDWSTDDTLVTILAFLGAVAVYLTRNPLRSRRLR